MDFITALATVLKTMAPNSPDVLAAVDKLLAQPPNPNPTPTPTPEPEPEPAPSPSSPIVVAAAPGSKFDMRNWKLNPPVPYPDGASQTTAPNINWGKGLESYKKDGIFELLSDDSVRMRAPVVGLRTSSGTKYTRTEFRETFAPGQPTPRDTPYNRNWKSNKGTHQLVGDLLVEKYATPDDSSKETKLCVGQIHGEEEEMCRLYVVKGKPVYFANDRAISGTGTAELKFQLKDVNGATLIVNEGERFQYEILADTVNLTVRAWKGGKMYSAVSKLSSYWTAGDNCYFKQGVYNGIHAPDIDGDFPGSGAGSVRFFNLTAPIHSADTIFVAS